MFQRLSCLQCVSYSALASPKSVLVFQRLSCLPCVSYYFLVSSMCLRDSKALLHFAGLLAVMRASLFKVKAWPHSQTDLLACITVLHCGHTFLKRTPVYTSVHVPHFITNNEVTPKEFSTKLSLSLLSPCLATQIIHFLPHVIICARRSIPSHMIRKQNLAYYL